MGLVGLGRNFFILFCVSGCVHLLVGRIWSCQISDCQPTLAYSLNKWHSLSLLVDFLFQFSLVFVLVFLAPDCLYPFLDVYWFLYVHRLSFLVLLFINFVLVPGQLTSARVEIIWPYRFASQPNHSAVRYYEAGFFDCNLYHQSHSERSETIHDVRLHRPRESEWARSCFDMRIAVCYSILLTALSMQPIYDVIGRHIWRNAAAAATAAAAAGHSAPFVTFVNL